MSVCTPRSARSPKRPEPGLEHGGSSKTPALPGFLISGGCYYAADKSQDDQWLGDAICPRTRCCRSMRRSSPCILYCTELRPENQKERLWETGHHTPNCN